MRQAIQIRTKVRLRTHIIACIIVMLLVSLALPAAENPMETRKIVHDLEHKLKTETLSNKEKLAILFRLTDRLPTRSMEKSIRYCNQLIQLAGQLDDIQSKARALHKLASLYMIKGDLEDAAGIFKEGLALYQQLNDKKGIAESFNRLGMLYINFDYQNIAQEYLLKSLKLREELGEKEPLFSSNLFLGIFYFSLENFEKAMEFFKRSISLAEALKDNKKKMRSAYYSGVCLFKMKKPAKAVNSLTQTLSYARQENSSFYIAAALNWIANIHGQQGQTELALMELEQAREIQEKYGFKGKLIYNYFFTGKIYMKINDVWKASHFFGLTLKLAGELHDLPTTEEVYRQYSLMFAATGDYKNAYLYFKKHAQARELLLDETRMKQISEMELQFESEKRMKEIELLKRIGKKQQVTRNTTLAILFLVLIILVLIFKKYLYLLAFWKTHKYFAQYRVISKIGSGGMGTVYLAHPVNDKKQKVAIKALREELMEDQTSRKRFKNEGAIIDKLEHPNIVKIHERGEFEGKLYLVMEYLEGKTLTQMLKEQGKLEIQTCLPIMIQIASALTFIHDRKIVHRDIKPANIMLLPGTNGHYKVKLLDFGVALAPAHTRLTQSGLLVGTINYLAPEQITGNRCTSAGDVYAMGVSFYEMITGNSPYTGESVTMIIERILEDLPPEPQAGARDIPGELNRLIHDMMAKTPHQRPNAGKVLDILKSIERRVLFPTA